VQSVFSGEFRGRRAGVKLSEDPDDLRFGEAGLFHVSLLGQMAGTHNFNLG
jgi:hypothetical protein